MVSLPSASPYPGVTGLFDRLAEAVHDTEEDVEVEFHLVTAGFVDVPSATVIADRFDSIIGGHWACDADGGIAAPKNTIGHYAKVRHLLALAKGVESTDSHRRNDIHRDFPEHQWHIPFEQMIFTGDGDSDLPAFELMKARAGTAIAVQQGDRWESWSKMRDGRQVATLARSDFREGSPLLDALMAAGQRAALRIKLLRTYERFGEQT